MIAYVSKFPIEIWKNAYLYRIEKEMKEQWITWLHAVFDDEEKAISLCGEDWYFLVWKG